MGCRHESSRPRARPVGARRRRRARRARAGTSSRTMRTVGSRSRDAGRDGDTRRVGRRAARRCHARRQEPRRAGGERARHRRSRRGNRGDLGDRARRPVAAEPDPRGDRDERQDDHHRAARGDLRGGGSPSGGRRQHRPAADVARRRRRSPDAWIVCELSSFQLEDSPTLRPRIAVLLNLEPDHLDRHGSVAAYEEAKLRIFANQGPDDVAVVPQRLRRRARGGTARRVRRLGRASGGAPDPGCPQPGERRGGDRRSACGGDPRRRDRGGASRPSRVSSTGSSRSRPSVVCGSSTTRRRRTSQPRCERLRRSRAHGST